MLAVVAGYFLNFNALKFNLEKKFIFTGGMIAGGFIISIILNNNYLSGLGILKGWVVLPMLFALATRSILGEEKIKNTYTAYYFSAATVAFAGMAYLFLEKLTFDGRLQAFFNSPNYLAMYLAPAIIVGVLSRDNFQYKFNFLDFRNSLYAISLALILTVFYLTYSYAAWLAAIGSMAIVEIIKNKRKINLKKALIFAVLVFGIILSQWNTQKFTELKSFSERSSFQSRLMIWKSSVEILKNNFLFGIGPGNFQEKYLEYQDKFPPYLEWAVPHPHNIGLAFWLYSGLIGLVGFLALIILWFKKILSAENEMKYMALGIICYVLLHGLIDTTYFKNDLAIVFWLNIAAVL